MSNSFIIPVETFDLFRYSSNYIHQYDALRHVLENTPLIEDLDLGDFLDVLEDAAVFQMDVIEDAPRYTLVYKEAQINYLEALFLIVAQLKSFYDTDEIDSEIEEKLDLFHRLQHSLRQSSIVVVDSEYEVPEAFYEITNIDQLFDVTEVQNYMDHSVRATFISSAHSVIFIVRHFDGQARLPIDQLVLLHQAIKENKQIVIVELGNEGFGENSQIAKLAQDNAFFEGDLSVFSGEDAITAMAEHLVSPEPNLS